MNILSAQEMNQAEQLFATLPIDPIYKLKLPADKEYLTISNFQSHIFPHTTTQIQKSVQKLITLSDNMRSLPQLQPSSPFYMLTYTLIGILYQDKYSASSDLENNLFLLETIKCSLYSKDVDMKIIRNAPPNYETKQLKLMAYRFFSFMEHPSLSLKTSRNKCAQWILTENPLLLLAFTLFLRVILSKIGIEEADDFKKCVSSEQAVTNLVEYFDLHYRSLGDLILFYQDGIFLALVEKEIVVGEYYLNEKEKQNQKQQLQIKQSVKLNMIQSFLVSVDGKVELGDSKKKGIVESDMKLFSFMLESSSDDDRDELTVPKDKDSEIQTPYFEDNHGQLNFYKNKKSGIFEPETIKNEIQRLVLDNSEEYNKDEDAKPTPYLGAEKQFAFINSFPLQMPTIQLTDVPPQLKAVQNKISENTHKSVEYSGLKRTVLENEKRMMFTSVMSQAKSAKQVCASTQSQNRCFQSSANKREQKVMQRQELCKCSCRKSKLMRNGIVSKVVEVIVIPSKGYLRQSNMANTMGAKYSYNYEFNIELKQKQECFSRQRVKQTVSKLEQKNYLERKPAFLKNLKKKQTLDPQVIHHQSRKQDCTQTLASQNKKNVSQERIKFNTLPDCIEETLDSHISRSTPKNQKHQSLKEGEKQKDNEKMFTINGYRSVVAKKPWQTNSNLIQKVPEYGKISKINTSDIFGPNVRRSSTSPIKFFAPVQIISPTVFVNSNHGNTDHVVFKLQEKNTKKQANPELNSYERQLANKAKGKTDVYHHRHF